MKVLVGGINQEANTFSPVVVTYKQFQRYYGEDMKKHLVQCELFTKENIEVIPAVYATIMPSAALEAEEFHLFIEDFFASYNSAEKIDAVYLCMHGGMYVNDIGSGELYFIEKLREKYGSKIPVFASFDFHGNMSQKLAKQLNYATAYRTAPHVDEEETGRRAVRALIKCLKENQLPICKCIKIPMAYPGEMVITEDYPCNVLIPALEKIAEDGLALDVSLFCGFIWSDSEQISMGVTVSAVEFPEELDRRVLAQIKRIWELREAFRYSVEALQPEDAVEEAVRIAKEKNLVFLSDSGDNVTAGASGDNAYMASLLVRSNAEKTIVTGLADKAAVGACRNHRAGERFDLQLGGSLDAESFRWKVTVKLLRTGELIPNRTQGTVKYALIKVKDVEILINEERYEFTELKHFLSAGISLMNYRLICIKLGYLYPELQKIANEAIIALSPGSADQILERIPYKRNKERLFPKDEVQYIPQIGG